MKTKKHSRPPIDKTSYNAEIVIEVQYKINKSYLNPNLDSEESQKQFCHELEYAMGLLNVGEQLGGLPTQREHGLVGQDKWVSSHDFLPEGIYRNNIESVRVVRKKAKSKYII